MRFVFIDEVEQQQKRQGFFGVASLVVDSKHYPALRTGVDSALNKAKWNRTAEFKGRYIFSNTLGDKNVPAEERIEIVRSIVSTTTAKKNARSRLCFAHNDKGRNPENYLALVERVLGKCEKIKTRKGDKSLAAVYLDSLNDVPRPDVETVVSGSLAKRGIDLVETPVVLPSSNNTAGLIAADVLAYLSSWDVIFPEPTEAQQALLFETEVERLNAKKLGIIREILGIVKQVEVIDA